MPGSRLAVRSALSAISRARLIAHWPATRNLAAAARGVAPELAQLGAVVAPARPVVALLAPCIPLGVGLLLGRRQVPPRATPELRHLVHALARIAIIRFR